MYDNQGQLKNEYYYKPELWSKGALFTSLLFYGIYLLLKYPVSSFHTIEVTLKMLKYKKNKGQ